MRTWVKILLLAVLCLGVTQTTHAAQRVQPQEESRFFPETQKYVSGPFLAYYDSLEDPLLVLGNPYSQEFFDPTTGYMVQYFDRARLEYHPTAPAGFQVVISPLGKLILRPNRLKPYNLDFNNSNCEAFKSQGSSYHVCYAFLDFYRRHGGEAIFGLPISNLSYEGDNIVQYFERARFEYLPEMGKEEWVRLSLIGQIQFDQSLKDPGLLSSEGDSTAGPPEVTGLSSLAFVTRAVIEAGARQTVTVVVRDQNQRAVVGATVTAVLTLADGTRVEHVFSALTNQNGIATQSFAVPELSANTLVPIKVKADYGGLKSNADTWFRIWH